MAAVPAATVLVSDRRETLLKTEHVSRSQSVPTHAVPDSQPENWFEDRGSNFSEEGS